MQESSSQKGKILITGGTSGLGYQLVKVFLKKGYHVVTTGRREVVHSEYCEKYTFYRADFSDLKTTAEVFRQIVGIHQFDIVINNAGILSPPKYTLTNDGLEYTFQVNFLAHLLADEIILEKQTDRKPLRIASITSPVYKLARIGTGSDKRYSPLRAYSDSKLYLALMSAHLAELHYGEGLISFSFDPGVFGSGIYRMQSRFFSFLYKIAAPFMRKPSKVAEILADVITGEKVTGNVIYNFRKRIKQIPWTDKAVTDMFWNDCHDKINPFLQ